MKGLSRAARAAQVRLQCALVERIEDGVRLVPCAVYFITLEGVTRQVQFAEAVLWGCAGDGGDAGESYRVVTVDKAVARAQGEPLASKLAALRAAAACARAQPGARVYVGPEMPGAAGANVVAARYLVRCRKSQITV